MSLPNERICPNCKEIVVPLREEGWDAWYSRYQARWVKTRRVEVKCPVCGHLFEKIEDEQIVPADVGGRTKADTLAEADGWEYYADAKCVPAEIGALALWADLRRRAGLELTEEEKSALQQAAQEIQERPSRRKLAVDALQAGAPMKPGLEGLREFLAWADMHSEFTMRIAYWLHPHPSVEDYVKGQGWW